MMEISLDSLFGEDRIICVPEVNETFFEDDTYEADDECFNEDDEVVEFEYYESEDDFDDEDDEDDVDLFPNGNEDMESYLEYWMNH